MPIIDHQGIVSDFIDFCMKVPGYEPGEPHTPIHDAMLEIGHLAYGAIRQKAERVAAFRECRATTPRNARSAFEGAR